MKHQCSGLAMLLLGVLVGTLAAPSNRTTNDDRSGHREEKRAPPALERLQELHAAGGLVMKMMHAGPGDAAIVNLQKPPIMRKDVENDGWLHSITHDQMDTAGIATLDGFDGVEGLEFQRGGRLAHSRDRTVLEGGRFDWQTGTWMRSAWSGHGWSFRWTMSSYFNTIIVIYADSPSFWTHEDPALVQPEHGLRYEHWSDFTFREYYDLAISTRVSFITSTEAGLGLLDLPPKEHAVTFPIGSYCHQLILGTRVGDQVGRLFYQHKAKLPACSVVAIHIWDSGINAAPAVLFSTQAYHEDVETIAIQNRAFEENGANIRCGDWPVKLKPQWIPASNQDTQTVWSIHTNGLNNLQDLDSGLYVPGIAEMQQPPPHHQSTKTGEWRHTEKTENALPEAVTALHGFDGVEDVKFTGRGSSDTWRDDQPVDASDPSEWTLRTWERGAACPEFQWWMSATSNTIVAMYAESPSFSMQSEPSSALPADWWHFHWSDFTFKEFTNVKKDRRMTIPPKNIFFPKLAGPPNDIAALKICMQGLGSTSKEDAWTFPIGSFCHELIMGTKVGIQVSKLLYEHKARTGDATVIAVHVWDSGDAEIPSVLFSVRLVDNVSRNVWRKNMAYNAEDEQVCAVLWAFNLKPRWIKADHK
ncbi:hypothetical protein CLAFUW4_12335 [Fulvia fulva]|uniref:Uncharacterized protein n=1 Tax=Passalora fulva TaxID=5499 RepID=A0A9Q8USN5_PASFU|nr:uncharacterized protein CLAFUR5_11365 [Fulvia fulva]KAK4618262.1 hypothetical protein CLAFUR4_12340 [Fulvia fulva]KAK4618846.1 hypothetical protein CLAFUR0_12351 [Fulvia fulva]UJO20967.1 hypothetical protein CLAFUR5_11365 [Fulvia fulva]WPV17787.1 hypothetical protein CLAFUW4_12335 [Fulvia fulva]WPV32901.1 hypothetical protein CLAFUW7_12342 [Fulvia fulva]